MRIEARGRLAALLTVGALFALLLPAAASAGPTDWTALRALNITHQGGEDEAPSATMYAFERSMLLGSDMLEVDVNTTEDGELALIHDGTVDRTTNGTGAVADFTMAELKKLDAANWFVPLDGVNHDAAEDQFVFRGVRTGEKQPPVGYGPGDFRPLELTELMDRYPDVPINIEIKGGENETAADYLQVAEVLAEFLNDYGRTEGIMVASFNDAALTRFHELAPEIDLAPATAAVATYLFADVQLAEGYKVFQVPIESSGITVVDEEFVDRAHSDGYGVHVWTINDEETMDQLWDWGVDGIMTAEPMRLEHNMCGRDEPRPKLAKSTGGKHCSKKVSIACDVEATAVDVKGKKAKVTIARHDNYDSRCAGQVILQAKGSKAKKKGKFDFGWHSPEAGGPEQVTAKVKLSKKLAKAIKKKGEVRVQTYPYGAFEARATLDAG